MASLYSFQPRIDVEAIGPTSPREVENQVSLNATPEENQVLEDPLHLLDRHFSLLELVVGLIDRAIGSVPDALAELVPRGDGPVLLRPRRLLGAVLVLEKGEGY